MFKRVQGLFLVVKNQHITLGPPFSVDFKYYLNMICMFGTMFLLTVFKHCAFMKGIFRRFIEWSIFEFPKYNSIATYLGKICSVYIEYFNSDLFIIH